MRALSVGVALVAAALGAPGTTHAFCGFYVGSSEASLRNDASMVVLLRDGQRTVVSMRNDYQGPPEELAMVVPVPAPIGAENVRTLAPELFEKLERLTAPRLVEYEQGPPRCPGPQTRSRSASIPRIRTGAASVWVDAQFPVGEYDVVVLGANDSAELDAWIREHGFRIPDGAEPFLRPYVGAGWRFLVARVDVSRIALDGDRARLSPLRIHYDSDELRLPVRLGLLNNAGVQDLVVLVLARGQRYEVASYPNVAIPTNLEVHDETRHGFAAFYDALFEHTLREHPGSVVTEYAWDADKCDPCPGPALDGADVTMLGGDVISGAVPVLSGPPVVSIGMPTRVSGRGHSAAGVSERLERLRSHWTECAVPYLRGLGGAVLEVHLEMDLDSTGRVTDVAAGGRGTARCVERSLRNARVAAPPIGLGPSRWSVPLRWVSTARLAQPSSEGFTLTRLHYRYGPDGLAEDLVFRVAPPLRGGLDPPNGAGTFPSRVEVGGDANRFQARYAMLHRWEEPIACESPIAGTWHAPRGARPEAAVELLSAASVATPLERLLASPMSAVRARRLGARAR